ncbi:MAG: anti-sigma factor, partial [Antricoccus sp.]
MHSLTGAYALDALDASEQAGMLEHLANCADCRFEVESFHQTLATFASLSEQPPPSRLRAEVLASIKTVRPLPPLVENPQTIFADAAGSPPSSAAQPVEAGARHGNNVIDARHRFRRTIAATAAVAAALIAIAIVVWPTTSSSKPAKVTATEQVRKAPDARSVSLKLNGGASATVVISRSLGRAVLVTDQMPTPPPGEVYQMWFLGA